VDIFWVAASCFALLAMTSASKSTVALPGDVSAWPTLLAFFVEKFPHVSREKWAQRFQDGEIRYQLVGAACRDPSPIRGDAGANSRGKLLLQHNAIARDTDPPRAHAKLTYQRHVENETLIPFEERVVYEDDHILVADKPHFLAVTPSGSYVNETLLARLKQRTGIATLSPAHRIDRETAGLVLFTKTIVARNPYQSLFRERRVEKIYEAIVHIRDESVLEKLPMTYRSRLERGEHFMQAVTVDGEPNAETLIELIGRFTSNGCSFAHLQLTPRTGARHQLRAQLAALGMPIVNDTIYPELKPFADPSRDDFAAPLQLLAKTLSFVDPIVKAQRIFQSAFNLSSPRT
jgi:tRNA pseudouridine32 synthase / 23S rRNA pseudouridine746 synthase